MALALRWLKSIPQARARVWIESFDLYVFASDKKCQLGTSKSLDTNR